MRAVPRYGFKASQWDVSWETLLAIWELGDELAEFDSGWLFDHFTGVRDRRPTETGAYEAVAVAAALAARTRRLRLGHLVLGNTHRHPALVASSAATIDHIAGPNRFVLGLGTGWLVDDHRRFGWDLPPLGERMGMLEAAVRIMKGMWTHPDGFSLQAGPYAVEGARTLPPPVTPGGPPVWLGTQGPRGLRIVAEFADGWSANVPPEEYLALRDTLLAACERANRDAAELELSAQVMCIGRPAHEIVAVASDLIGYGAQHLIFVILASDGPRALRSLHSDVVLPLRERFG